MLKFVATGAITLMLSACYGVVTAMYGAPVPNNFKSCQVIAKSNDGLRLPGIKVTLIDFYAVPHAMGYTNEFGFQDFSFEYMGSEKLLLEDMDGVKNGGEFAATETDIKFTDSTIIVPMNFKTP